MSDSNHDNSHKTGIWLGIGAATLAHGLVALILTFTGYGLVPFLFIGLFQLLYLAPLAVFIPTNNRYGKGMSLGVWYAVGITFLLNAACFGLVITGAIMWSF